MPLKFSRVASARSRADLDEAERQVITTRNSMVPHGLNLTEGGTGGVQAEEVIRRMSLNRKGIPRDPEAARKTALANTGKKRTEASKLLISLALKGKPRVQRKKREPLSEEHRLKISATLKGRPNPARHGIPVIAPATKRPPRSAQWCAKLAEAAQRREAQKRGVAGGATSGPVV